MRFSPIASSSAGCAYVLAGPADAGGLLIDCGQTKRQLQVGTRFQLSEFAGCLISHVHGDHCSGAKSLLDMGINCYASAETWEAYRGGEYKGYRRAIEITPGPVFEVGSWQVIGYPLIHDAPGTLGFLVKGHGGKFLYMTDTAYSEFTFKDLTHIAIECNWSEAQIRANTRTGEVSSDRFKRTVTNHMSLERAIRFLQKHDLSACREIWLLHLSDQNSNEQEFKLAVQRATGKPVFIAPKQAVRA